MIRILSSIFILFLLFVGLNAPSRADDEVFGPPNLLKTFGTPFGAPQDSSTQAGDTKVQLSQTNGPAVRSLSSRLLSPRLYLPGRMVIGRTAEFIIKGRPGYWAALSMADRNAGARPIYGHELRLGPDRKLVSLGQIPDSGVLSLVIDTPIQGDLIGQCWYFEAAIWSRPDFADMELATPVPSDSQALTVSGSQSPAAPGSQKSAASASGEDKVNGVIVSAQPEHKRGIRIVPDAAVQIQPIQGAASLDSGRP